MEALATMQADKLPLKEGKTWDDPEEFKTIVKLEQSGYLDSKTGREENLQVSLLLQEQMSLKFLESTK